MIRHPDHVSSNPNLSHTPPPAQLPQRLKDPSSPNIHLPAPSQYRVPLILYSSASPPLINTYPPAGGPLQPEHTSLSSPANYATSSVTSTYQPYSLPHIWRPFTSSRLGQPFAPPIHQELTYFPNSLPTRPFVLRKNARNLWDEATLLPSLHRAGGDAIPPLDYTPPPQPMATTTPPDTTDPDNAVSFCSRCKKEFIQDGTSTSTGTGRRKTYKLCMHCRALQRERSRRWQNKTKGIQGACRRCGNRIPQGPETRFVLCSVCRHRLRIHKKSRCQRDESDTYQTSALQYSLHDPSSPGPSQSDPHF